MKRTAQQQTFDATLLQRVSQIRIHMGLDALPTTISMSELDPLLRFFLLHEAEADAVIDPETIFQQETWFTLIQWEEKWGQWPDWTQWDKWDVMG